MIGKLTGTIEDVSGDSAIVDVAGVGYTVFGSSRTLGRLAQATGAVSLFIETHVREEVMVMMSHLILANCFPLEKS